MTRWWDNDARKHKGASLDIGMFEATCRRVLNEGVTEEQIAFMRRRAAMIKVGFTGTRKGMTQVQQEDVRLALQGLFDGSPHGAIFIHGDCLGADAEAHELALAIGYSIRLYPCYIKGRPPWKPHRAYCKHFFNCRAPKPPLERNHDIVDAVDVLLAAPGTTKEVLRSGTWATIRYARKTDTRVVIFSPRIIQPT